MRAESREWLAKRGLLERVPKYIAGTTDSGAFSREVERLCGPEAKGAFQSKYGPEALSPEWMTKQGIPPKDGDMGALSCVLNVMTYAGYQVGFVGNGANRP